MATNKMDSATREHALGMPCPVCRGTMHVSALACEPCGVRVEARFRGNEFADLPVEHLQLLRVFVLCEGRIREMEKVLGVSYPTVKNRIAALRVQLGLDVDASGSTPMPDASERNAMEVLDALERGELDAAQAAAALRGDGSG